MERASKVHCRPLHAQSVVSVRTIELCFGAAAAATAAADQVVCWRGSGCGGAGRRRGCIGGGKSKASFGVEIGRTHGIQDESHGGGWSTKLFLSTQKVCYGGTPIRSSSLRVQIFLAAAASVGSVAPIPERRRIESVKGSRKGLHSIKIDWQQRHDLIIGLVHPPSELGVEIFGRQVKLPLSETHNSFEKSDAPGI